MIDFLLIETKLGLSTVLSYIAFEDWRKEDRIKRKPDMCANVLIIVGP